MNDITRLVNSRAIILIYCNTEIFDTLRQYKYNKGYNLNPAHWSWNDLCLKNNMVLLLVDQLTKTGLTVDKPESGKKSGWYPWYGHLDVQNLQRLT